MDTVVVLMLENRSFDHLAGYLQEPGYGIDGLTGEEFNYRNPSDPASPMELVSDNAPYVPDLDPDANHDVRDVAVQLFGSVSPAPNAQPMNNGFVYDYGQVAGVQAKDARRVMDCFASKKLPVLSTLAKEFALCDHWFSSVPGPTWPNRFFLHACTSLGYTDNNPRDYNMRTIFENISDVGKTWRIYFHSPDLPQSIMLSNLRNLKYLRFFENVSAFFRDCNQGRLPNYSFIEPRYFTKLGKPANDEHPCNGVVEGEKLIAAVYEALRSSPQWNNSLLLVLWDEHGGFYDHVAPGPAANPDGRVSPECDFSLLGVRVPAILVSPLIPKQTIVKKVLDHSSLAATLKVVFDLRSFLTKRDGSANRFDDILTLRQPRGDCPLTLAGPSIAQEVVPVEDVREAAKQIDAAAGLADRSPSELQKHFVSAANYLSQAHLLGVPAMKPALFGTEGEAGSHVAAVTERLLSVRDQQKSPQTAH